MNIPVPEKLKYIPAAGELDLQETFDRVYIILNEQHNKINEIIDYLERKAVEQQIEESKLPESDKQVLRDFQKERRARGKTKLKEFGYDFCPVCGRATEEV